MSLKGIRFCNDAGVEFDFPAFEKYFFCPEFIELVNESSRVLVYSEKNIISSAFVLSAFNINLPFVPVDSSSPFIRVKKIFEDIQPQFLFIQKKLQLFLQDFTGVNFRLIKEDEEFSLFEVLIQVQYNNPPDLAAILFTSGSTGVPKGVMIPRLAIESFVSWMVSDNSLGEDSVFLSVSPLSFDLSLFEIFGAAASGASLIFPERLYPFNPLYLFDIVRQHRVNVLYVTPSWIKAFMDFGNRKKEQLDFVLTVLLAGEELKENLVANLRNTFPLAVIKNLYGPTETNVCTFYVLPEKPESHNGVVSIGRPCPYCKVKLSEGGELLISGQTNFLGYWPNLVLNEYYPTGDIVTFDQKTELYFYCGRLDNQLKKNGFRIEKGEVENIALELVGVTQAALVLDTINGVDFLTLHLQGNQLSQSGVHDFLKNRLPFYMLPDRFVFHEKLPLNSNGKIDYQSLKK